MNIQIFKLINGDTVVTETKRTKTGIKFIDPMLMVSTIDPKLGISNLVLYRWIPFTEGPIIVQKSAIIASIPAPEKHQKFYTNTLERMRAATASPHTDDEDDESDIFESKEDADMLAKILKAYKGNIQ
jgi:hypothetical protein